MTTRIAIDMQGALTVGSRPRGIGRYTCDLVSAMARLAGPSITLMMNGNFTAAADETWGTMGASNPSLARSDYRVPTLENWYETGASARRRISDAIVRRHVADLSPDVLLFTSLFEAAPPDYKPIDLEGFPTPVTAAILYDLIPLVFEETYLSERPTRAFYTETARTLKTATLLLAISASVKQEAVELLHIPADRIAVIGGAANERFRPTRIDPAHAEALKARFGLDRDFVMYVAAGDPRKNLSGTIEAVATMPGGGEDKPQVLLVTNASTETCEDLIRKADELGLPADGLRIAREISDEDLVSLLNLGCALLFPSFHEGFGLPVLEAMQCGTPVVVARTSSLPEIVDREDLLFDPASPEQAGAILHRLLNDAAYRSEVSRWGIARAASFSWDRSAQLALDAMADAVAKTDAPSQSPLRTCLLDLDGARHDLIDPLVAVPAEDTSVASFVGDLLFSVPRFVHGRRLLIDATMCAQIAAWTGIQRVVRKLTAAFYWDAITDHDFVPVAIRFDLGRPQAAVDHIALSLGDTDVASPYEVDIRPGDDLFMLDSTWEAYPQLTGYFREVRHFGGRIFTCVYDLIPELHPEVCAAGMSRVHSEWLRTAVAENDGLICISKAVADELLTYIADHKLPHRPGLKIGWFHCGSDIDRYHSFARVRDDVQAVFSTDTPTFLAVGTLEPRKCHALAVDAFELLWAQGLDARLVFIGAHGWMIDALADRIKSHPEYNKRLFWFAGASDKDVSHAYERAAAVIAMSMAEGFGLPLAEAARLDKPVICSDIPVFLEVGGEGAVYFKSEDATAMAEAVKDWLAGRRTADPSKISRTTWKEAAHRIGRIIYADEWYKILP